MEDIITIDNEEYIAGGEFFSFRSSGKNISTCLKMVEDKVNSIRKFLFNEKDELRNRGYYMRYETTGIPVIKTHNNESKFGIAMLLIFFMKSLGLKLEDLIATEKKLNEYDNNKSSPLIKQK